MAHASKPWIPINAAMRAAAEGMPRAPAVPSPGSSGLPLVDPLAQQRALISDQERAAKAQFFQAFRDRERADEEFERRRALRQAELDRELVRIDQQYRQIFAPLRRGLILGAMDGGDA